MHTMTRKAWTICVALLSMMTVGLWAQEVEPGEEAPTEFYYYIPFPESTFRGDWHFKLEMGVTLPVAYRLTLLGYDRFGNLVLSQDSEARSRWTVFTWEDSEETFQSHLQSLVIVSDTPLRGVLWMWNDLLDIINGVSVDELQGPSLVLPHIPSDFFTWRTSFAVLGVSEGGHSGDVVFGYSANRQVMSEVEAWEGLGDNGYFNGSPFYNILIGDAASVSWGRVQSPTPGFNLAGFQTFLSMDGNFQSAAIELADQGVSEGYFGFSSDGDTPFSEWFAFTNPNEESVQLDFVLNVRPAGEDQEVIPEIVSLMDSLTIGAFERRNLVLGQGLFNGVTGDYLSLSFRVLPADEETAPLGVYGTHLQSRSDRTALGAHSQVANLGNRSMTWLDMGERFSGRFEVYNPGTELVTIDVSATDIFGDPLFQIPLEVTPGNRVSLTSDEVRKVILEEFEDLDTNQTLRLDFASSDGLFFSKVSAFRGGDFAVINPLLEYEPSELLEKPDPIEE